MLTNNIIIINIHHINDALTTRQLFRNSSDSPERRARILRVADSTMTCGKDCNRRMAHASKRSGGSLVRGPAGSRNVQARCPGTTGDSPSWRYGVTPGKSPGYNMRAHFIFISYGDVVKSKGGVRSQLYRIT